MGIGSFSNMTFGRHLRKTERKCMRWAAPHHSQSRHQIAGLAQSHQSETYPQSGLRTGTNRDWGQRNEEQICRQMWESQNASISLYISRWPTWSRRQAGVSQIFNLGLQMSYSHKNNSCFHSIEQNPSLAFLYSLSLIICVSFKISEVYGLFSSTSNSGGNCSQESKDTWWAVLQSVYAFISKWVSVCVMLLSVLFPWRHEVVSQQKALCVVHF